MVKLMSPTGWEPSRSELLKSGVQSHPTAGLPHESLSSLHEELNISLEK